MTSPSSHDPASLSAPLRDQLELFLDDHRRGIADSLDGLTEDEVRRRLVPSSTTLLGLLKHAVFLEQVWFDEAVTGRPRTEIGCAPGPEESFVLDPGDTTASVLATYARVCAASRAATAHLGVDDLVTGNRRGPLPLRWVHLHVIRELAQHGGHADILREQVLAARTPDRG